MDTDTHSFKYTDEHVDDELFKRLFLVGFKKRQPDEFKEAQSWYCVKIRRNPPGQGVFRMLSVRLDDGNEIEEWLDENTPGYSFEYGDTIIFKSVSDLLHFKLRWQ